MRLNVVLLAVIIVLNINIVWGQAKWNQFRGPNGSGIAPDANKLPVEFDESKNFIRLFSFA